MEERPRSPTQARPRWRWVVVVLIVAMAVGLLSARPWSAPKYDCVVTVRPGESIQEAINAAEAGAVICLARGVWKENLVINKSLTLVGRGGGRTVIETRSRFVTLVDIAGSRSEAFDVRLEGVALVGIGGGSGVAIGGTSAVEIRNCQISGTMYGVQAEDSSRVIIENSTISENSQRGVMLSDSARATVSRSRISGNRGAGVWLSGSAGAAFADCESSGNFGHAFWLRDRATLKLSDCSASRNWGHGLWLTNDSSAQVLGSTVSANSDHGIKADDRCIVEVTDTHVLSNWSGIELGYGARATILNSNVSGNRLDGIRIGDSARATVSDSTISANRRGLGLSGEAQAEVTGCLIKENLGYGVFSWFGAKVAGEGNEFRDNGIDLGGNLAGTLRAPLKEPTESAIAWPDDRYASLQEAVDALLPGGTLLLEVGTYMAGLTIGTELSIESGGGEVILWAKSESLPVLSLVDGADLRLVGTTISGGSTGLSLSAGAGVMLIGCTISENTEGINLSYSSSAELIGCDIAGNSRGGIFVDGEARAVIRGCSISNHGDYGITAAGFAHVAITDSVVTGTGWDGGVVLWDSSEVILEANRITDNRGYGVAVFVHPCFAIDAWPFRGRLSGSSNVITANMRGDVCPPELVFLVTEEGGELDLRP